MVEEFQTTWREREATTNPFKQNDAELLLQPVDLTAKRWLRHAQGACRG
jgi:hypothetical protein